MFKGKVKSIDVYDENALALQLNEITKEYIVLGMTEDDRGIPTLWLFIKEGE